VIPLDFHEFLIACVGASASFVGLLFVGLSVVMARAGHEPGLSSNERLQAQSAYAALINIFFVAMVGLMPNANVGSVSLVLAGLGLVSSWRMLRLGALVSLGATMLVYVGEAALGISALAHPHQTVNVSALQAVILFLFGIGLFRAWELTGVRQER
jgi:hypothetical protein